MNGIFNMQRRNQKTLYFVLPFVGIGFWIPAVPNNSNDATIYFGTDDLSTTCSGGLEKIIEDYRYRPRNGATAGYMNNAFSLGTDVLVSTNYAAMNAFWNSNKILVAFRRSGSQFLDVNNDALTFDASSSGSAIGAPFVTLDLSSNKEYKVVRRKFLAPYQNGIPAGATVTVWVQAKFRNPSDPNSPIIINGIQTITVPPGVTYDQVAVDIRGPLLNFTLGDPAVYLIRFF